MFKKLLPIFGFIFISFIFFWQFFFKGLVPISSDTIVGLYHPYRDFYAKDYPRGIPFKNFLITDPVRQQYPWRSLSMVTLESKSLPTWNPYAFSGTPGIANFQSAVFYPFNIIFLFVPYIFSWSFLIIIQPLLAGIFLYLYLRNLKLDVYSSFFGSVIFAFSGFFTTWLEWGTVLNTALWLPLLLLSIDKINTSVRKQDKVIWGLTFLIGLVFAIFAGHLQTLFYLFIFIFVYFLARLWQSKKRIELLSVLAVSALFALATGVVQLLPTFKFIQLSGRGLDTVLWREEGWFLPFRHLVQFIAPDYFGNPTTLNYWGAWNYGELTGYAGITVLILGIFAILYRRDKKTWFFTLALIISLIFVLPNFISRLPFLLNLPFISTSQPTRLIFIIDFSLAVLGALGLNYLILKGKVKQIILPIIAIGILIVSLFIFTFIGANYGLELADLAVSRRNMLLPIGLFGIYSILIISIIIFPKKFRNILLVILILITITDLFRFSWKFNTFSKLEYLYPKTKSIDFMRNNLGTYRIATADPRLMAPNFQIMHGLYSVEGYDPLYIARYAELITAINRNKPDINPPFGFNRIIRVDNFSSPLINLLGIKFVMSLSDLNNPNFEKVYEEGETKIYENKSAVSKAFFVEEISNADSKQDAIDKMFSANFNPLKTAIVEGRIKNNFTLGTIEILKYSSEEIKIRTVNAGEGYLVLNDVYYPTWHAMIDNQSTEIYQTDFAFRGVIVPKGEHLVIFKNKLL